MRFREYFFRRQLSFWHLARLLSCLVGDCVCGNPVEPGDKGGATPFELANVRQGLLKNVRSEILSLRTVLNTARDVGVDPMEVLLIKLRKAARIPLSSLYSHAFVRFSNPTQVSLAPVF